MALAYAQSLGDGTTRNYNVTFPFISRDHIKVKVNGVEVAFSWLTDTTIQLASAPAVNAVVDIRRVTPRDKLLVDFKDASTLVESDLDLSALQTFYLSQEAFDLGEASLGVTDDGSFSALNRRISNAIDPVDSMDVVNKRWAESGMTSQLNLATQRANAAKTSETNSKTSETNAKTSETNAAASRNTATIKASKAAASATNAANSATTSSTKASEAAASANAALGYKNDAAASAAAAAQSAQDAAMFDPSSYYTKVEIDTSMSAKLNASAYTAADVLAKLKTVDGARSGLDADLLDGQSSAYYTNIIARLGFTPANAGISITAGNGLRGGGTLGASRSLAVGQGTGIAVAATSVSVDDTVWRDGNQPTYGQIGALIAQMPVGAIGSYGLFWNEVNETTTPGTTRPGSQLTYANGNTSGAGTSPRGTWRIMGDANPGTGTPRISVWMRIS